MTSNIQLCRLAKANLEKGDKSHAKGDDFYISAGKYLKELKEQTKSQKDFLALVKKHVGLGQE